MKPVSFGRVYKSNHLQRDDLPRYSHTKRRDGPETLNFEKYFAVDLSNHEGALCSVAFFTLNAK